MKKAEKILSFIRGHGSRRHLYHMVRDQEGRQNRGGHCGEMTVQLPGHA